jgi:ATP-dependent DNA helicase RecG
MNGLDQGLEPLLGAKSAKALASALDLHTVDELLRHYPRRYAKRGELTKISGLEIGEHATVLARVAKVSQRPMRQRRGTITEVIITDGGRELTCVFFSKKVPNLHKLHAGVQALFAGKVGVFQRKMQLSHPEFALLEGDDDATLSSFARALIPVYPAAAGMQSWAIARCVDQVLDMLDTVADPLPEGLREQRSLIQLDAALQLIHRPSSEADIEAARDRLKWDEALSVQLVLALSRADAAKQSAPACPPKPAGIAAAFEQRLPFTLTEGQQEVGEAVAADLSGTHPMNRLLQGEVGSGKTIVALRAMLQVVDSGKQAALLAPTEVLAAQHARSLRDMLGDLAEAGQLGGAEEATRVALLTGSMGAAARKQAMLDVAGGAAGIVVGTHALIQDKVSFAELGLVVVDEQHRFGVEQRDALRGRGPSDSTPHVLVMTATPIPRTVAMTVYGDLSVSSLRQLPRGRSPISTNVVPVAEKPAWLGRAWQRITEEVEAGHQAYVVCPRIGDVEGTDEEVEPDPAQRRPPLAVLDIAPMLTDGPLAKQKVAVLHGKLPGDEKDGIMRSFSAGDIDVLVATTVIEVGVDVPNATTMVIMDAERFGISQLHQLRGRIGRGSAAGLCLLVTESLDGTLARERLDAVASTVDGFELATLDLQMRREGDVLGATQSGTRSQLKMLSLLRDEDVITAARGYAESIVDEDPELAAHPGMAGMVGAVLNEDRAQYLSKA